MTFLAVITGGGTGIGRSQALALSKVEDGAVVIITGRRLEPLLSTQKEIGPDRCHVLADCDVGSTASWERIVAKVEELGGVLHFLGNTAGGPGFLMTPYESIDPEELIAYNATYITSLQLSYHYMAPFLARGAEQRGKPSVVMDMSSAAAVANRGMASMYAMYIPCKVAMNAITRSAYGMYKDRNVSVYGINPLGYLTDMLREGAETFGMTIEQFCSVNPFLEQGDPVDFGDLSAAAARQEMFGLESGVSYVMFPIPAEYRDPDDPVGSGSVLYNVTAHGPDIDGLDYDGTRRVMTKLTSAFYSNGKKIPEAKMRKLVAGIEEVRLRCQQNSSA